MSGTLLGIAQIAVSIAGFAAIVEVVGKRDSRWDRDEFNGMVFHALIALVFSLAPLALDELGLASPRAWSVLCGLLGALMALHVAAVLAFFLRPQRRGVAAWWLLAPGALGLALVATALDWLPLRASGAFLAGLCLQLVQAAILFFRLVYQREVRSD
jgi:O-antigen/teichoic acid export membrane protein